MARLEIREYAEMALDAWGNPVPVGLEPAIASSNIDIISTPQTLALNSRTKFVRLHTDAICNFDVSEGGSPSPEQGGGGRMAADQTEHFGVRAADETNRTVTIGVIEDT